MSRIDRIFEGIHLGKPAEEIFNSIRREELSDGRKKGRGSEKLFVKHMWAYYGHVVKGVVETDYTRDYDGIDYYVTFSDGLTLPVQVKSSDTAVDEFKRNPKFVNNFGKKIIVVNSASYVSRREFKEHFSAELRRVKNLLDKESHHIDT